MERKIQDNANILEQYPQHRQKLNEVLNSAHNLFGEDFEEPWIIIFQEDIDIVSADSRLNIIYVSSGFFEKSSPEAFGGAIAHESAHLYHNHTLENPLSDECQADHTATHIAPAEWLIEILSHPDDINQEATHKHPATQDRLNMLNNEEILDLPIGTPLSPQCIPVSNSNERYDTLSTENTLTR